MQTEIKYDRATREFALYLNGKHVGYAANYHEGNIALDKMVEDIQAQGVTE